MFHIRCTPLLAVITMNKICRDLMAIETLPLLNFQVFYRYTCTSDVEVEFLFSL